MCNVCSILISVFWIFQPWPVWQQVSVELGKWDGQYDERWVGGYYKKSLVFTTQHSLQSVSSHSMSGLTLWLVLLCCCHIPRLLLSVVAAESWFSLATHTLSSALQTALSLVSPLPTTGRDRQTGPTRASVSPTTSSQWPPDAPPGPDLSSDGHQPHQTPGGAHQGHHEAGHHPPDPPALLLLAGGGLGPGRSGCRHSAATGHWLQAGPCYTFWQISVCKVRAQTRWALFVACLPNVPMCPWHVMSISHQNKSQQRLDMSPLTLERQETASWDASECLMAAGSVPPSQWVQLHVTLSSSTESGPGRANQPGPEPSLAAGFYNSDWLELDTFCPSFRV